NDAAPVGLDQGVGDLYRMLEGNGPWQTTLEAAGERLALQVLHDEKVGALLMTDVVERAEVWMTQRRNGAGLLLEAAKSLRIAAECGGQHLDRDEAVQPRIAGLIHLSHAAGAKQSDDFVDTEPRAGEERHGPGWWVIIPASCAGV